jgi:Flp pilus assembly protein TadB
MRSNVFVLALMLVAVPTVQAQQSRAAAADHPAAETEQLTASVAAPALNLRPVDAPVGFTRSNAALETVESNRAAETSTALQDPSARNILAIIGAIVIVIALIALLN